MNWRPRVGDRVEYSPEGLLALNPRSGQRRGVVTGKSHALESVSVRWDGLKYTRSYWHGFLSPGGDDPLTAGICPVHQRMIDLCREGKTVKEISEEVGRVAQAIYPVLRKAGLVAKRYVKPRVAGFWTEERCAALTALWQSGRSASAIARLMNVTRNSVIGKAHRLNLTPRRSPIKRAA